MSKHAVSSLTVQIIMSLQIIKILRNPKLGFTALTLSAVQLVTLLYFDQLLFFSPYVVFYLPRNTGGIFGLDLTLSAFSGVVLALSVYQLRNLPQTGGKHGKLGFTGVATAILAGACPCYYLVPLLAVAGGIGGVLGTAGIVFFTYQVPIKLSSLILLAFVTFTLERSFRAYCGPAN